MTCAVLGCGRWGSFIAWYLDSIGHRVTLYGRAGSKTLAALRAQRGNELLQLRETVTLTDDLAGALAQAQTVVISVGAQGLSKLMAELAGQLTGKTLVLCMKGLEEATGRRLTQIVAQYAPEVPVAIWVGPGHVQDFVSNKPNCMVIDSDDAAVKEQLVSEFSSGLIRFYYGSDLIGNEVGAASKNVIGIAAGVLDGLDLASLKGALMSRGAREIARLLAAMGGKEITAYGLGHLGDYEATVFSPFSHNRKFGESFARKEPYGQLAEGVSTSVAMMHLSRRYGVELPICQGVYRIIHRGEEPRAVLSGLFDRTIKDEF